MARIHTLDNRNSLPMYNVAESMPPQRPCIEYIFPGFRWMSAIMVISLIQIVLYITMVIYGNSPQDVTAPSVETLITFGAAVPELIRSKFEIYRLICPIFLHINVLHILFNIFFQLRLGLELEAKYGWKKLTCCYLISGILANLISSAVFFCNQLKAGASTSIYGLIGIQLAMLALSWDMIQDKSPIYLQLLVFVFITLIFSVGRSFDIVGHVGGCMVGFVCGLFLERNAQQKPGWFPTVLKSCTAALSSILILSIVAIWTIPRCQ